MTNEQLALLLDPERRMHPQWWRYHFVGPNSSGCTISGDAEMAASDDWQPTGEPSSHIPDWHASDDACFRDWRPVLLAAGCQITDSRFHGVEVYLGDAWINMIDRWTKSTYRAATIVAIEKLDATHPELLREAIAQIIKGE